MDRLEVPRPRRSRVPWIMLALVRSDRLFRGRPERIKRGEASDLRWECAGDVPYVQIAMLLSNQIIGPFPARGTVRVRPKQDEFYSLRPQSTNNVQIPSETVHIFVTP